MIKERMFYAPLGVEYDALGNLQALRVLQFTCKCEMRYEQAYDEHKEEIPLLMSYAAGMTIFEVTSQQVIRVTDKGARGSLESKLCKRFFGQSTSFGNGAISGSQGIELAYYTMDGRVITNMFSVVITIGIRLKDKAIAPAWVIDSTGCIYPMIQSKNVVLHTLATAMQGMEKIQEDVVLRKLLAALPRAEYTESSLKQQVPLYYQVAVQENNTQRAAEILCNTTYAPFYNYSPEAFGKVPTQELKGNNVSVNTNTKQVTINDAIGAVVLPPSVISASITQIRYEVPIKFMAPKYLMLLMHIQNLKAPLLLPSIDTVSEHANVPTTMQLKVNAASPQAFSSVLEIPRTSKIQTLHLSLFKQFYNTLILPTAEKALVELRATQPTLTLQVIPSNTVSPRVRKAPIYAISASGETKQIALMLDNVNKSIVACHHDDEAIGKGPFKNVVKLGGNVCYIADPNADEFVAVKKGNLFVQIPSITDAVTTMHITGKIACLTITLPDISAMEAKQRYSTKQGKKIIYIDGDVDCLVFGNYYSALYARFFEVHIRHDLIERIEKRTDESGRYAIAKSELTLWPYATKVTVPNIPITWRYVLVGYSQSKKTLDEYIQAGVLQEDA